jgi:hypothetical protein
MPGDMEMLAEGGEPMSLDEAQEQARQDQESARSEHEDEREKSMPARTPMKGKIIHEDDLMMAEGGMIDLDEQEDEKHASIAAAIMAKKRREMQSSDSDEDRMVMMAEGGQVDLSRNADEDPNEEDQMSFEALKKENYSESAGLDQLDSPMDSSEHGDEREHDAENKHDMVSAIRRKMASRRQFSKP